MIKLLKNIFTHPIVNNDGGFWGEVAIAGASLLGSYMSSQGQSKANKQNRKEADKNRAFQERMSSSAHQRQVEDMKKAGLNPILSSNTGASSPAGGMATMQNEQEATQRGMENAVSTALQNKRLSQDLKNLEAQEKHIKQQTEKTKTEDTILKAREPEARLRNKVGKYAEGLASSAKSLHMPDKSIANLIPSVEKRNIKKAESKAEKNYKKSQAHKDRQAWLAKQKKSKKGKK